MKYIFTLLSIFILIYQPSENDIPLPAYFRSETYGGGWSLKLFQDSTFLYKDYTDRVSSYCEGYWHQVGDTLILNSYKLPKISYTKEIREDNGNELRIDLIGADSNEYFIEKLFYNTSDSTYQFKRKIDRNMSPPTYFFLIEKSRLYSNNRNFTIQLEDYSFNFTVKDTTANIIKVYINDSRKLVSRDMKNYFKNKKIFIYKNNLYLINTNSYGTKWDFPAVRQY
jgi:hypothetical protein